MASSSTSLLYHIYDQINLPEEQQYQPTLSELTNGAPCKKTTTTTILNPSNLFSQQQQQCYPGSASAAAYHLQQQPLNTLYQSSYMSAPQHQHLQQQQQQQNQSNLMLGTMMRYHAQQRTMMRQQHATQQRIMSRPLSSSAASPDDWPISSGESSGLPITYESPGLPITYESTGLPITYGRHARTSAPSQVSAAESVVRKAKSTQITQRLLYLLREYRTIVKCFFLLILLVFSLMSIIKFTLLSSGASTTNNNQPLTISQQQQQQQAAISNILMSSGVSAQRQQHQQHLHSSQPTLVDSSEQDSSELQPTAPTQDLLKSKLVIGEFVILSQNYSSSQAQKSLLAERIVKLESNSFLTHISPKKQMDQVFLGHAEVRRVYSRMEVTNIRENRPHGILVECNIVLSDSIPYAAQHFGIALYDSLSKSHERLANQAGYIVDKNSIRFNTVPDKDLKSGIVPPGLISPTLSRELALSGPTSEPVAPSMGEFPSTEPNNLHQRPQQPATLLDPLDQMNLVVWSEWSLWSPCVNKEGVCDPSRLHSRLRKCVSQHTGEKVEAIQCRQRFSMQDQELELADCSRTCQQQQQSSSPEVSHVMSDAPSPLGPQTAPSVLLEPAALPPLFMQPAALSGRSKMKESQAQQQQVDSFSVSPPSNVAATVASSTSPVSVSPANANQGSPGPLGDALASTMLPNLQLEQQSQMSCSNCTSDEICLLLVHQKVPFCAKIKERTDCGGWCKAPGQVCQPQGPNAFKCIQDSECLATEWRCHDSACIPLSKRCDGHSNCYDSSDERDCPIQII